MSHARSFSAFLIALATIAVHTAFAPAGNSSQASVDAQLARLANPDHDQSESDDALATLKAGGPAAVAALIADLDQPSRDKREAAIEALGQIGDPSAIAPLTKIAVSDNYGSVIACRSIAMIGGPDAATCLIAVLRRPVTGGYIREIAPELAAIGDNRAVEPLVEILRGKLIRAETVQDYVAIEDKIRARESAATALGRFRDPRARTALRKAAANDPNWDVHFAADQALIQIDRPDIETNSGPIFAMALSKRPEPAGGAEAFIRQYYAQTHGQAQWAPYVDNFADPKDIAKARDRVMQMADSPYTATATVETLMSYMTNRKWGPEPANAYDLLVKIGPSALPALKLGEHRGDIELKRRCRKCIAEIEARASIAPASPTTFHNAD